MASELGVQEDQIRKGLKAFAGVKRRFTRTGSFNGIDIFDDYGHHPVEIAAVLKAARKVSRGRVIAVMQPHRYTRLAHLFDEFCRCFNDAHVVVVAPVYAAGEDPIEGATGAALAHALRQRGHVDVRFVAAKEDLAREIATEVRTGDVAMALGAGDIVRVGAQLVTELGGAHPAASAAGRTGR